MYQYLGPDAILRETVLVILRSLLLSDDSELKKLALKKSVSDSERGESVVRLLTTDNIKVVKPQIKTVRAMITPQQAVEIKKQQQAIKEAVQVTAKIAQVDKKILTSALKRAQTIRPIQAKFIKSKSGPPGWLGKLVQWGHTFQSQYFKWLYDHNQAAADERAGECTRAISGLGKCKKSGPSYRERRYTDMRGKLWGYSYAEPGCSLNVFNPKSGPKLGFKPSPQYMLYEYIAWTTGQRTPAYNFALNYHTLFHNTRPHKNETPVSQSLFFKQSVIDELFKKNRYFDRPDPRWKSLPTDRDINRFMLWCMNARWLVWAAECWRANDPKNQAISRSVERRWIAHTQKWGVGFVFPHRLAERELFGTQLETDQGEKTAARMNANSTVGFNTGRMLDLVMQHTTPLMDLDNFKADTFNTMCDWNEVATGSFKPAILYPGVKLPADYSGVATALSGAWTKQLERKITREHAHSPVQKTLKNVAKSIVGIISAEIGGMGAVYLDQLMASAEGVVSEVISEVLDSQLWATVTSPVGKAAKIFETELQDRVSDIWGLYDSIRRKTLDEFYSIEKDVKPLVDSLKAQYTTTKNEFPWAGDLYGEVIALPYDSAKVERYFR